MSPTEQPSAEYLRGWRDGYGQGRDDEAAGLDFREAPDRAPARQQTAPRNRQINHPGRDR
ncbi:hypothetical protein [Streptomyces sp. CC219B]|uniref:hypothetical protein n=1 Tax=Streptomyces sp. CC219B TaxID=3044574 RepID=UPI0024A9CC53|nr:hypothetical protein [Streptomyces sp. CC219B]